MTLVKLEQPIKHKGLKEVTEEGIVTFIKPEAEKQPSPKEVTEEGIVILVKSQHPSYLLLVDYQYYTL